MSLYYKILQAFKEVGKVDDHAYFPQFRLEGRARDANNQDSLAMRTADPLWMLGRQWQFGEFIGEDNGSPAHALAEYYKHQTEIAAQGVEAEWREKPLEVAVEAMPYRILRLRERVRVGEQFKRIIRRRHPTQAGNLINLLKEYFPLQEPQKIDAASRRFFQLMSH